MICVPLNPFGPFLSLIENVLGVVGVARLSRLRIKTLAAEAHNKASNGCQAKENEYHRQRQCQLSIWLARIIHQHESRSREEIHHAAAYNAKLVSARIRLIYEWHCWDARHCL